MFHNNLSSRKLHSLTMSTVYSILLVLHPVAHLFLTNDDSHILSSRIIQTLHSIIATLYWWPRSDLDGEIEEKCSSSLYTKTSISFLRSQVQNFCRDVDNLHHAEIGSLIDKPNIHRLVELINRTIPTFGHVRIISEMHFETVHQTLNRALKGNTHRNKHITSVYHAACADWHRRLIQQFDAVSHSIGEDRFLLMRNLATLFVGEDALKLRHSNKDEE